MITYITASGSEPIFMSYVDATGKAKLVDGGVRDNVPLEKAIELANIDVNFKNYDSIFIDVVVNSPKDPIRNKKFEPTNLLKSLTRTIEIFQNEIRNNDLRVFNLLDMQNKNIKIRTNESQKSKIIIIQFYFIPVDLYEGYRNELVFDLPKMTILWQKGELLNYTDKNGTNYIDGIPKNISKKTNRFVLEYETWENYCYPERY